MNTPHKPQSILSLLRPTKWNKEQNDAWNHAIPNIQKAFDDLIVATLKRVDNTMTDKDERIAALEAELEQHKDALVAVDMARKEGLQKLTATQLRVKELRDLLGLVIEFDYIPHMAEPSLRTKVIEALSTTDNDEALRKYVAGELRKMLEYTGSYMLMNEIAVLWTDVEEYTDRYEKGEVK